MSVKVEWSLNGLYQANMKNQRVVIGDVCIKGYDVSKPLYLETDASGVGLGGSLLQMQEGMSCEPNDVPDNVALCPIVFEARISPVWSGNTATLKEKHWVYCMGSRCFTTTALQEEDI